MSNTKTLQMTNASGGFLAQLMSTACIQKTGNEVDEMIDIGSHSYTSIALAKVGQRLS